jgi:hypothetical protein
MIDQSVISGLQVLFDAENKRVGFATADCSYIGENRKASEDKGAAKEPAVKSVPAAAADVAAGPSSDEGADPAASEDGKEKEEEEEEGADEQAQ